MYGNVENNLKISMHDFIEAENKNLLNTSTVAFRNALEIERNERENTGLKYQCMILFSNVMLSPTSKPLKM